MKTLKRILLIEDSLTDVDLTLAALEEHNLANEVVVARDGIEALDYLHRRGQFADYAEGLPAVIFLDIKMPKMDGLEVLRQIKVNPRFKNIPVVMLTSSKEERDLNEAYRLGANSYVVKPVEFDAFVRAVEQLGLYWAQLNQL